MGIGPVSFREIERAGTATGAALLIVETLLRSCSVITSNLSLGKSGPNYEVILERLLRLHLKHTRQYIARLVPPGVHGLRAKTLK
jgi:hypothetical protein